MRYTLNGPEITLDPERLKKLFSREVLERTFAPENAERAINKTASSVDRMLDEATGGWWLSAQNNRQR